VARDSVLQQTKLKHDHQLAIDFDHELFGPDFRMADDEFIPKDESKITKDRDSEKGEIKQTNKCHEHAIVLNQLVNQAMTT
jgi:hypothetical protein